MCEVAKESEQKEKEKKKVRHDKKAVERFKVGQMVLIHTPELVGKLDSIWEGPYEVTLSAQPLTNY